MKLKSYNILFRIFSFLSDKTNGASFFVKYKLLLGTIILGSISSSAKASKREVAHDTIPRPIPAKVTCYKISATPTLQKSDSIEVRGNIKEGSGEPLIGVSIEIKNKSVGTISDIDGNFTLKAKYDDVLIFLYLGFKRKEISVSEIRFGKVSVIMEEDNVISRPSKSHFSHKV